jgi:hypothetical protein
MDPFEKAERKRQAQRRLRAQREQVGRLKARVVAISLVCFALLWGVVFIQMATGNDPVLGHPSSAVGQEEVFVEEPVEAEAEPVEEEPAPVTTSQS